MTRLKLQRLLTAPEIIVVSLTSDALRALRFALLAEHPLLLDDLDAHDDPPLQRSARDLLHRAGDLQRALERYRRRVNVGLRRASSRPDDIPF